MSLFTETRPEQNDQPQVLQRKILQRLNSDATAKLTEPGTTINNPQYVEGTLPHDDAPALVTRPASNFEFDVARGLHPEHFNVHKFGYNAAVPNGSFADIYTNGAATPLYPWPTSASVLNIKAGGDAADTAAGAGAQSILVQGLDADFNPIEELIVTAGAGASANTTASFRRVSRAFVVDAGTYTGANADDIDIENVANNVVAQIPAGMGQTQQTHYTVPAGKTAYLTCFHTQVSAGANKDADVRFFQRLNADDAATPFGAKRLVLQRIGLQGPDHQPILAFIPFAAKTDLWAEAQGNGAVTGVDISYDLIVI
jgi:hypothetical protein